MGARRRSIAALAALAYGEPRRRAYWEKELLNALVIVERGWGTPAEMRGSWAGAMGHTQWMPEVWLNMGFDYDRAARAAGQSKFPFRAMLGLAVDGLVNHSLLPLRLASTVSLLAGLFTFLVLLGYLVGKLLFGQEWPPGFATLVVLLLMSMTLNAMFLGILGEYIGRIFLQTKNINAPIVEAALNAPGPVTPFRMEAAE